MEGDACSSYAEEVKPSWRCFSYEEISRATNKFHPDNLVGRGGFAEVFKGSLRSGQNVAVKRLAKGEAGQLKEKEFLVELGILGHVRHPNTANLIGCCIENGLHLISDFGLAKWLPKQWTHHSVIPIEGTFGYLAPEYFMHGIVDEKTDVFAFGVLLLEIVTGRRPVDTSKQSLLVWAKPLIESGRIAELADPKLEGKYDMDQMQRLVLTASYCVRQSSIWRPPMSKVLGLLTNDRDSLEAQIRSIIPECQVDEMDDYNLATDCSLDY
ncbi:hypothetical protein C4D60_Mb09t19860 [Musa balbisiana]|uniref:Protein kinase domain-containing protein n=1 Tax=Musa balbisiana TaxID=52838 RepID=A0A4S8IHM8_MUSBA|nr:hypothetical protein C4D60_Mb09t19860 [Musa balbisiana]